MMRRREFISLLGDALEKRVLAALGRANGLNPRAERLVSALLRIDMPLRLA